MLCPICGKENDEHHKFCNGCGYNLSLAASLAGTAATAAPVAEPAAPAEPVAASTEPQTETVATPAEPVAAPAAPAAPVGQPAGANSYAAAPSAVATNPTYNPYGTYTQPPQNYYSQPAPSIPPEYTPIGAWMYCLWGLLFSIPLVGFILLIVFSCGGTQNINLRNYARSHFCSMLITAVIAILLLIVGLALGASFAGIASSAMY